MKLLREYMHSSANFSMEASENQHIFPDIIIIKEDTKIIANLLSEISLISEFYIMLSIPFPINMT